MEKTLTEAVVKLPAHKTEVFRGVLEQLRWFAGKQVKSVAVSPDQAPAGPLIPSRMQAKLEGEIADSHW